MYQQRLGLAFQHGEADGDQLRVVLTQVGEAGMQCWMGLGGCAWPS